MVKTCEIEFADIGWLHPPVLVVTPPNVTPMAPKKRPHKGLLDSV